VDSLLTLTVEPAKEFQFTFNMNMNRSAIATAASFAGAMFVNFASFSETETTHNDYANSDYLFDESERRLLNPK
jgi:hypothetical protein